MNRTLPGALLRRLLWLTLAAMPLSSHAIEEPRYEVIRKLDNVELRQYALYVVAEVALDATAEDAGRRAFSILAGYIFGKNTGERQFAMTAPVTQAAVPGGMRVQFGPAGAGASQRPHDAVVHAPQRIWLALR